MASRPDIMAGRAYVSLFVKSSAFEKALRKAQQNLASFGAEMTNIGRQMLTMAAGIGVPLALASKRFADFDDAIRAVRAVTQASESDFRNLTEVAKELGRTTSFTAVEVASLMTELGRAGFKPTQIIEMTGAVLDLARATGTDATLASGIMASSIRQFSLSAEDARRVADGLTSAANNSFNTVEQLGEALSYAGPVASDFNMSIEDTLALLGGLGNVGIQASNAGTALRRLLTLNAAEAGNMQRIFGVAFLDAAGNARPLVDVLSEVNDATAGLSTGQRAKKFNEAFGLLGITGASAIGRSAGDIRALAETIKGATGVAADAAQQMDAGLGGSFRKFLSAAEGVAIALGESLAEPMQRVADLATQAAGVIVRFIGNNRRLIVTVAKVAAGLAAAGASLMAVGSIASLAAASLGAILATVVMLKAAFAGFLTVAAGIATLMTPMAALVAAVLALKSAEMIASGSMGRLIATIRTSFSAVAGFVTSVMQSVRESVLQTFGGIYRAMADGNLAVAALIAFTGVKLVVLQALDSLRQYVGNAFSGMMMSLANQVMKGDLAGAFTTMSLGIAAVWDAFTAGIVSTFTSAAKMAVNIWKQAVKLIMDGISNLASQGGIFEQVFGGVAGKAMNKAVNASDKLLENAFGDGKLDAMAGNLNSALDAVNNATAGQAAGAAGAFAKNLATESSEASDEIKRLQAQLDSLTANAAEQKKAADAAPVEVPGANTPGGMGAGPASSAMFSAAGILASTQGTAMAKQTALLEKQDKKLEMANEHLANMLVAMRGMALTHG